MSGFIALAAVATYIGLGFGARWVLDRWSGKRSGPIATAICVALWPSVLFMAGAYLALDRLLEALDREAESR